MGYSSRDLNILDEMIQDTAKTKLIEYHEKQKVILTETEGIDYFVTIHQIPQNTLVIKSDDFAEPQTFFQGKRGECKRSDFVIITDDDKGKFIIFVEMKASSASEEKIVQQFKGAECLIAYCQKIGQLFWNYENFLTDYKRRFISIKQIKLSRPPSREKRSPKIHDRPENMLKISYTKDLIFKKLIGNL